MCGLFAFLNNSGKPFESEVLMKATERLRHRGPDDFGYAFVDESGASAWRDAPPRQFWGAGIALGHRRLAILDRSSAGRQPFTNARRSLWLVYNGEIFNYVELRRELIASGCCFETETDTEVLLRAFETWGCACFDRLNGMWALLIWDVRDRKLIACRDRFGIKPLNYAEIDGDIAFASEASAIFATGKVGQAANEESLVRYLSRFAAPCASETFYRGIRQVPPGAWLEVRDDRVTVHRYWAPPREEAKHLSKSAAIEEFRGLFADSVKLRLRADVRTGTMLSGGLDSTSVISEVADQVSSGGPESASLGGSVQAFHATFPNLPIFESDRVNDLLAMLKLRAHFVHPLDHADPMALFHDCLAHMDGPFMNSVPMVNRLLMRRAHREGVIVVLNGHGADELFAGYPALYLDVAAGQDLKRLAVLRTARQVAGMQRMLGISRRQAVRRVLNQTLPYRALPWNWMGRPDQHAAGLMRRSPSSGDFAARLTPARSRLDQLLRRDFFHDVLPAWLNLEDRMSMAESVEARLPFLDYRLVEFAFRLPDRLRVRDGNTKYIVREAMRNRLPSSIVEEKRKFYFSGPDAVWMRSYLRPSIRRLMFDREPGIAHLVDCGRLRTAFDAFWRGDDSKVKFLWTAFCTEYWISKFASNG